MNKIQPAIVYTMTFFAIPVWGIWLLSLVK
nr:MAG TPA: hypothetical protein [Caudoviricetes sp.]DAZ79873.1 MAG TPA: hypothetical protein [Caudoviricetes sp.]